MDEAAAPLETALRQLADIGELIDDDGERQRWRFSVDAVALELHFFPRPTAPLRRITRTNSAMSEMIRLQWLQKASVPCARARSVLLGFVLRARLGDALLLNAEATSRSLDEVLFEGRHNQTFSNRRRKYVMQLIDILRGMAKAGLGHRSLRLRRFSVDANDCLTLDDARGLDRGGLRLKQLFELAHDARGLLTRGDVVRAWTALGTDRPAPFRNFLANRLWRRFDRSTLRSNEHFGYLVAGEWSGIYTRRSPQPYDWVTATLRRPRATQWESIFPTILDAATSTDFASLKSDASGDVLSGDIVLGGLPLKVVVKRPRTKFWWRHFTQFFRGSRARRTWTKSWKLLIRNIPCEFPLLMMERKRLGYAIESIIVFEHVPGPTLAAAELDSLSADERHDLFDRTGALLRKIDDLGFMHADAKSTNWIVTNDRRGEPRPILIDADGVRHYRWALMGLNRLLRAMKQHVQYQPADAKALCLGYAPEARR